MFKIHNKDSRTYFTPCSSASIVNFKLVDVSWVMACKTWVGSASESLKKNCFILILTKSLPTQMPSLVNRTESPFYQPKPWTWNWKSKMWILWNKRYWLYWYERKTLSRRTAAIGGVLKKVFAKLTGKQPCQSLFIRDSDQRSQHWCFPVNSGKFFRTTFLQNIFRQELASEKSI